MSKRKTTLFFAFANDRRVEGDYLRNIPEERRRILKALGEGGNSDPFEIADLPNATHEEVMHKLIGDEVSDRISLFHFAGHAGDAAIMLETPEGKPSTTHAEGLAQILGRLSGLKLVFLNGCSTEAQATALLGAGVPSVIVTSEAIGDAAATKLAGHFYRGVAKGKSIQRSYDDAKSALKAHFGNNLRSAYQRSFVPPAGERLAWPWKFLAGTGADCVLVDLPQDPSGRVTPQVFSVVQAVGQLYVAAQLAFADSLRRLASRLSLRSGIARFALVMIAIYLAVGLIADIKLTELRQGTMVGPPSSYDGISFANRSSMIIYMLEKTQLQYFPWTIPLSLQSEILALGMVCGFVGGALRDFLVRLSTARWPEQRGDLFGLVGGLLVALALIFVFPLPELVVGACLLCGLLPLGQMITRLTIMIENERS